MTGPRTFYNGATGRNEVWLDRWMKDSEHVGWCVWDWDATNNCRFYDDTDEGFASALADYEARVAARTGAS